MARGNEGVGEEWSQSEEVLSEEENLFFLIQLVAIGTCQAR